MVDLHTHSTASDGTFTPTELIIEAKKTGLDAVALTDHDIIAGLEEAETEAKKQNIIFIRGIEISVNWQPGEFHLLGLNLKKDSAALDSLIKNLQSERINRNIRITEKMNKCGFDINYEKLKNFIKDENMGSICIGRPHFAAYMVRHKIVKTNQEAFDKYLGKNRPFFEEKKNADFEEAVFAIKSAGGIPVLAHPMSLYLSWTKLPDAISDLKTRGLMGLEAWNSSTRYNDCKRLEDLAGELDLIVTAGSDFHGNVRKDRKLGTTSNGIKIENRFYENLRILCPDLPEIPR